MTSEQHPNNQHCEAESDYRKLAIVVTVVMILTVGGMAAGGYVLAGRLSTAPADVLDKVIQVEQQVQQLQLRLRTEPSQVLSKVVQVEKKVDLLDSEVKAIKSALQK